MPSLGLLIAALLVFARTAIGYAFTEPSVDEPDYTRTYIFGDTVSITWNQTAPRVKLRLDPLSSSNAFEYAITYATLLDNATNTGGYQWTIGTNDNVTLDLILQNPRMFFQLNDATGADDFTLDSRPFLVVGGNNSVSTSPTYTTTTTVTATHTISISGSAQNGLSQAGKVGLGLGIPFALLCLGLLAALMFILRKRKKGGTLVSTMLASGENQQRSELESHQNTFSSYGDGHAAFIPPHGSHSPGLGAELPEK